MFPAQFVPVEVGENGDFGESGDSGSGGPCEGEVPGDVGSEEFWWLRARLRRLRSMSACRDPRSEYVVVFFSKNLSFPFLFGPHVDLAITLASVSYRRKARVSQWLSPKVK
mmetsp:Transcript_1152/g.2554  ORF Transcript_1152/g.2554 Transcript_1152/m.2554 type:complete len:111 (-) Transcript_1152:603-935(-)